MSMKLNSRKEFLDTCILHTLSSCQIMIDFTTRSYIYTYIYIQFSNKIYCVANAQNVQERRKMHHQSITKHLQSKLQQQQQMEIQKSLLTNGREKELGGWVSGLGTQYPYLRGFVNMVAEERDKVTEMAKDKPQCISKVAGKYDIVWNFHYHSSPTLCLNLVAPSHSRLIAVPGHSCCCCCCPPLLLLL